MCSRAQEEPLIKYWFRQFKEEPLRVLILAVLAAMCYLYNDGQQAQAEYRADMKAQNEALTAQIRESTAVLGTMKTQLELMNNRLGHLEREHEMIRKASEQ